MGGGSALWNEKNGKFGSWAAADTGTGRIYRLHSSQKKAKTPQSGISAGVREPLTEIESRSRRQPARCNVTACNTSATQNSEKYVLLLGISVDIDTN